MRIIEIAALSNGAHNNQTGGIDFLPPGWAVIPENMELENFPFGDVTVEEIDGIPTVTGWAPGTLPDPEPVPVPPPGPTAQDDIDAMLVDHEYRLALLELGLTE